MLRRVLIAAASGLVIVLAALSLSWLAAPPLYFGPFVFSVLEVPVYASGFIVLLGRNPASVMIFLWLFWSLGVLVLLLAIDVLRAALGWSPMRSDRRGRA